MNMGDDLASSAAGLTVKVAETTINTTTQLIAMIIKMLQEAQEHRMRMSEFSKNGAAKNPSVNQSEYLNELKGGEVKMDALLRNARKAGDMIVSSENGISKADAAKLAKLAKDYGVPIAFTHTKSDDNIHVHVRSSDGQMLKQMLTDLVQDKIKNEPKAYGNFKVNAWEIPYLTNELNKYNLNAQFGKTKDGEYFCMFEKADQKALLIARGEFIKKYNEVNKDFIVDRDEKNFFTLKDVRTGKEITFDDMNVGYKELTEKIQSEFGYDENKAAIAAAKFGEENLEGEVKDNYFSNPQNETRSITTNIELDDDDIYATQYTCMRVVPKKDNMTRIVFVAPDGKFAAIDPNMKRSEIVNEIKTKLDLDDPKEIDSLVRKAEKAILHYDKIDNSEKYSSKYKFSKKDFNMSEPSVASNMRREENGHVYTRSLPLDNLELEIERLGKNRFVVHSNAIHIELDDENVYHKSVETEITACSLADKRRAIHAMEEMLKKQGVPEAVAKRAARDAFAKAESQEIQRRATVTEIKTSISEYYSDDVAVEVTVLSGGKTATINITDPEESAEKLAESFGISDDKAKSMVEDIGDKISERQQNYLEHLGYKCDDWTVGEASFVISKIQKNHWKIPEGMEPANFNIEDVREEIAENIASIGGR